jgi:hypothetical protein
MCVIDISSGKTTCAGRKQALERSEDYSTLSSPARKRPGRPAKTASHEGQFTAAKRRTWAAQREEEEASEDAKRDLDPSHRAEGHRAMDIRRKAEEKSHRMRMDPTADIAAHEGLETLMKAVEKNVKGSLKNAL